MSRIIAAFAGVGKTYFCGLHPNALDFVIMPFKYRNCIEVAEQFSEGEALKAHEALELRENWQKIYYQALIDTYNHYPNEVLVIPTEHHILQMLEQDRIPYTVVYPHRDLKEEYRQRYLDRGNTEEFIGIFIGLWDMWMSSVRSNSGIHIELKSGEFLADVISPQSKTTGIIENRTSYITRLAHAFCDEHFELLE